MKIKIIALSFLILVLPFGLVSADLVPCDLYGDNSCTICHLFQLFTNIVGFVLTVIVPPVATIMFLYGGILFYTSGGVPEKVNKAKGVMIYAVFGLIIIYSAWVIVGEFLNAIGVETTTGLKTWWEIECETPVPDDLDEYLQVHPPVSFQELNQNLQPSTVGEPLLFLDVNDPLEDEEFPLPDF